MSSNMLQFVLKLTQSNVYQERGPHEHGIIVHEEMMSTPIGVRLEIDENKVT